MARKLVRGRNKGKQRLHRSVACGNTKSEAAWQKLLEYGAVDKPTKCPHCMRQRSLVSSQVQKRSARQHVYMSCRKCHRYFNVYIVPNGEHQGKLILICSAFFSEDNFFCRGCFFKMPFPWHRYKQLKEDEKSEYSSQKLSFGRGSLHP